MSAQQQAVESLRSWWASRNPKRLAQFGLITREFVKYGRAWGLSFHWKSYIQIDSSEPTEGWIATAHTWEEAIAIAQALLDEIAVLRANAANLRNRKPPETARRKPLIAKGATR